MILLAEAIVSHGTAPLSGLRSNPESPEHPEDRGEQPEEYQPTAVIPPTARSPPPGPPCLNISAADSTHLSRFLAYPFEHYTRLKDLRSEIGGMPTRLYIALKTGLTMTARQQIQRIRRQAYSQRHERNVKQLQRERDAMAQQLDHAQRTAFTL